MRLAPLLCMLVWIASMPAEAALSTADEEALSGALRVLSGGPDADAARVATEILESPEHGASDHARFLGGYAARRPLTTPLARFLAERALDAASPSVRQALQEGLSAAAAGEIEALLEAWLPDRLGAALGDETRFEHARAAFELLGRIASQGRDLPAGARRARYQQLRGVVAAHPGVLRKNVTIDVGSQPRVAALRAQLYKNLQDLLLPFDAGSFVSATGFQGDYAEFVRNHGVLVLDNNGLDEQQRRAIREVLAVIPPSLHRTAHISVHDLLGNRDERGVAMPLTGSGGVNIFALSLNSHPDNNFPSDFEPHAVPGFCAVLQHELNHMVDHHSVSGNAARARRRDQLIAQAGSDPRRYLRSMLEPGYFVRHPQEFFASISNAYFSDSFQTLELALQRFDEGWPEPLNQFLFFADVYSRGGDTTTFVRQTAACEYSLHLVAIGRDERGHVDRIQLPESTLRFELDDEGNVLR